MGSSLVNRRLCTAFLALLEDAFGIRLTLPGDDEERWSGTLLPLTRVAP
ncbi:hypothetical protein ACFT7S_20245 [Streptomyces sp. NPDC057136]